MTELHPYRDIPRNPDFNSKDVLVLFGEAFSRGYVNGLIDEAQKAGMKIIYSTVGRRDKDDTLRPLTAEELQDKQGPLINIPLEAGFDMAPASDGTRPIDQMKDLGLKDWMTAKLDWSKISQSKASGITDFKKRCGQWAEQLAKQIPAGARVVFAHTMAGGVPRAKVIMPAMNRVFKGHGARFASSEEFWQTDLGRLCSESFDEVTAHTFEHLIQCTKSLRAKIEADGGDVSYVAYGYHGTEVLMRGEYQWQSYSPYLQGFAKIKLEEIAKNHWKSGVKAMVFNAPEILTNSSSIFLGVEVPLYSLMGALKKEKPDHPLTHKILNECAQKLKPEYNIDFIMKTTSDYFESDVIRKWTRFDIWPQHNGPDQMEKMRQTSDLLLETHKSEKDLMTATLSEVVFQACGKVMLAEADKPRSPVWWIGHDAVARASLN